jgi:hypothetical protein
MGDKLARTIQDLQHQDMAVLIAESDTKRLGFVKTIYTIERGQIAAQADGQP